MSMKNPLTPAGIEPATLRFVAQHLNHCVTAVPEKKHYNNEKTKQMEAFCQTLVQNLVGLQGSLILGAAHEEDQTHKPVK